LTETPSGLRRQLGLASSTALVAGECIAVGIFLTPAGMAKALGSPLWLLVVWLVVGAMTLSGALCYGELAGRFPRTGGTYVYLLEVFGRGAAFLYGWMCLLVLDPGLTASLAVGTAGYAAYIFHWSPFVVKLAAMAIIWGLCVLNILSIRLSAGFLRWITWLKLGVLASLVVWAIVFRLGSWSNFVPFVAQRPGSLPLGPALGIGMVGAFYSFGGWWEVNKIAGEVRDPAHTVPRALALGVVVVIAVYILISGIFLYLLPLEKVASDETFVAQVGEVLFGPAGGVVFAAIVVVCVLGSLAAFIMSAPHVGASRLLCDGARWPFPAVRCSHSAALRHARGSNCHPGDRRIVVGRSRKLSADHRVFYFCGSGISGTHGGGIVHFEKPRSRCGICGSNPGLSAYAAGLSSVGGGFAGSDCSP